MPATEHPNPDPDPPSYVSSTTVAPREPAGGATLTLHPTSTGPLKVELRASRVARELQTWPPRARTDVGAVDEFLIVLEGVVRVADAFLDEADERHPLSKVSEVFDSFAEVGEVYGPRVSQFMLDLNEEGMERLVKKYARSDYVDHVRRMVGQATFYRLHVAVSQDCDTVAAAAHVGLEQLMPYAQAMGDLASQLTETEVLELMDFNPAGGLMLEMVLKLLDNLDVVVRKVSLPEHLIELERVRRTTPTVEDILGLTAELRERVSGQSRELVKEVSAVLERKLRGAKDALAYSADSNCQAATSLIEFIDRLLRAAYTEDEVLEWVNGNYTDLDNLLTDPDGQGNVHPTKRAQALCMLHGAQHVAEPSSVHVLLATSLNVTRRRLQKIKHADLGTDEEREQLEQCLVAVEAFVQLGCRLAWAVLPDQALADLRARLDPTAAKPAVVKGQTA